MEILFLSLVDFISFDTSNIYTDVLKEFVDNGHKVHAISPFQSDLPYKDKLISVGDSDILKIKIGQIQKTNLIKKGISTLTIENKVIKGIKKYYSNIKFDLILYSTPPVTFFKIIKFVKNRDHAFTYLLLKDIFPQNAVDLNKISKNGLIYKYFRKTEINLYKISDFIGTMSEGNSRYLLEHNKFLTNDKVEVNGNSLKVELVEGEKKELTNLRKKMNIPELATVIFYGGNLGQPQGIDFLIKIVQANQSDQSLFFLIVGSGTDAYKLKKLSISNLKYIDQVSQSEFNSIQEVADVGLILLDSRFTIPNIPSRMLGYMKESLPILAATDVNTDLKDIILDNKIGLWSVHGDQNQFSINLNILKDRAIREKIGANSLKLLQNEYSSIQTYKKIINRVRGN